MKKKGGRLTQNHRHNAKPENTWAAKIEGKFRKKEQKKMDPGS